MEHLLLTCPENWSNDARGDFFESFVADVLRPMRFKVRQRLRFTGMEIDLLAKSEDQPRTVLVECKAHRDPLPADVISKLIGNVALRRADAGWLFSTGDLTKDGRGQWEEVQNDAALAQRFMWYSPQRLIDVLKQQRVVVDPLTLSPRLRDSVIGNWTLIVTPTGRHWLVEIIESGMPTRFVVFDATTGEPLDASRAAAVATVEPRFSALEPLELETKQLILELRERAPVARVISGEAWDDLRPAHPKGFVGRDDIIADLTAFITDVRDGNTSTRTFAVQGPSGWGKSSLVLKIADLGGHSRLARCSVTAVDSRSATNSAFVSEAFRLALVDASARRLLPVGFDPVLRSIRDPLDSPDIQQACDELTKKRACIVLIFDQFEELFAKEQLFETFNAVRELSLDLDARQLPVVLGFAWKTDASLPQQHPAYHLWHQLSDRRRTFKIREFGKRDIQKIISGAEASSGKRLSPAVRTRVSDQSQNLPWLLKKLLVHVLQRVSSEESQYIFLERELDVELLFKEDLSVLPEEPVRCLKYVAQRAPVAIAEVEENFSRDTTNLLIDSRLLVRSGMNYVVYWDVFRDYLVDGRVPHIPWARTFQRGAAIAVRALQILSDTAPITIPKVGIALGLKEGPAFNLFGDLVALQLVESSSPGMYAPNRHLRNLDPLTIAEFVQGQLRRHVVVKEIFSRWEKEKPVDATSWVTFFSGALPRSNSFSTSTIHQYANSFKSWLLFAGILEQRERLLVRPSGRGAQMGALSINLPRPAMFLGTSAPEKLELLVRTLIGEPAGERREALQRRGLRNALADAAAIGIVDQDAEGRIRLNLRITVFDDALAEIKRRISDSTLIQITKRALDGRSNVPREEIGKAVAAAIGAKWKPASVKRYGSGLVRFAEWSSR